ncbi:P-type ATPase [Tieghemostelium lacteum]|uniref:Plasma membrane ATPase n=1 Tax=Tieghemostelium lacteum TaxID=361077 RepID=A0A151Z3Q2_TIELA|nr:P-type ATPase [Tieghemostelium lacteum]|eukprot:KYQ88590.1 P-type ATPase [Tieghemostelium lacteum]
MDSNNNPDEDVNKSDKLDNSNNNIRIPEDSVINVPTGTQSEKATRKADLISSPNLNSNNNNNNNQVEGNQSEKIVRRGGSMLNIPNLNMNEVASSTKTFAGFSSAKETDEPGPKEIQITNEKPYDYRGTWMPRLHSELFENPENIRKRNQTIRDHNYRRTLVKEKIEAKEGKKPIDEVLQELGCTANGLTKAEVQQRTETYGPNKLPEVKRYPILEFLYFMWNPLSWTMEIAAIVSIGLLDWVDFILICALLLLNATIGFIEEHTAGNAVEALKNSLVSNIRCMRDGQWEMVPSPDLVPGDVVMLKIGAIIPADCRLIECEQVKVDQSSLTGESMPISKVEGDEVYSGSSMKQGEAKAVVTKTGVNTFFGRAANLVATTEGHGHLQIILRNIGLFCICFIAIWVLVELLVVFLAYDGYCHGVGDGKCTPLNNALVLLVGGIPIAMPTVLSVTMAIGATQLSKKQAIVSRLACIEELAGMDILCSDKTGTLTLNVLTVDTPITFDGSTAEEVMFISFLGCSEGEDMDAIDKAITNYCKETYPNADYANNKVTKHFPFNPTDKKAMGLVQGPNGKVYKAAKGAPQIMLNEAYNKPQINDAVSKEIDNLADRGYRALGVSVSYNAPNFDQWKFLGLIPLFDPPRHDTEETIKRALDMGVSVKMITGDQLAIAKETARRLGMGGNLFTIPYLEHNDLGMSEGEVIEMADGFAEMWPEHKYKVVDELQKRKHVVGMTGDGVNDAPALKKAQIGVAVAGATDAARSVSDIVLTSSGLSVIIDAIITSRKIFQRMRNYVIYSVSATVRICTTFGILTVAWNFMFPTIATVIIAILNDGTMLTISKDRVKPRNEPDRWDLKEVFTMAICYGGYLVASTIVYFAIVHDTTWFQDHLNLRFLNDNEIRGLIYLQVSISGLATIFVSRSQGFSYFERPGFLVIFAFVMSQVVATFIGVYGLRGYPHDDNRTSMQGCGWGWAVTTWIWCILWYIPMDFIKLAITKFFGHKIVFINPDALDKMYKMFYGQEKYDQRIQKRKAASKAQYDATIIKEKEMVPIESSHRTPTTNNNSNTTSTNSPKIPENTKHE